jgi:hypothetical protein
MMEWSPHQAVEFGHQPSELIRILNELGYIPKTSQRKLLTGMAWTALDGLHSGTSRNVLFVHR